MKKVLVLLVLICASCEVHTPAGSVAVVHHVEVPEVCTYDDTPYYYEDVWTCWGACCTWIIDYPYYYTTCEETWCVYETLAGATAYCSWELADEYCY